MLSKLSHVEKKEIIKLLLTMKIIDCITYFNEPMLFELRLNILDKYVDEFVVCESLFTHAGKNKELYFDIKKFKDFSKKIKYIVLEKEPNTLIKDSENKNVSNVLRYNAEKRIKYQRNEIFKKIKNNDPEDWIIYSDSDEIPNLEEIDLRNSKEKFIVFNQNIFYYKFNLTLKNHNWHGSKACRLKNLSSITDLRNVKTRKYGWWRIDTLFKKNKYINLKVVNNGGWHFTELKSAEEIFEKHKNDEHHDEFELTGIKLDDVKNMIQNRYIPYDHRADKKDLNSKWGKNIKVPLVKIDNKFLPKYLIENKDKYLKWFD